MEEKSADEMFKELGYEKEMLGHSKIIYTKRIDDDGYAKSSFYFDKVSKNLHPHVSIINHKEVQAIYKVMKELRWL